ncbi:hypothetical protein [Bradyrhizobium sp. Y36]|nr:hypothetical protein [Bradyrhizobium sp. Y36]
MDTAVWAFAGAFTLAALALLVKRKIKISLNWKGLVIEIGGPSKV